MQTAEIEQRFNVAFWVLLGAALSAGGGLY